jgi:N-acetylglucosamine-6-phosphate deacetylase
MTTGYIDLQVNGYAGVDFNGDDYTADDLHRVCARMRDDGVEAILGTIITAPLDAMARRLRRLVEYRQSDPLTRDMVRGLHIEGPFLNPTDGYRGAHLREAIQPADPDAMLRLLDAGDGLVRLVTLAPECDPGLRTTAMLAGQGITVSGGHCNADLDQLHAAIDAGMTMFTHVGNGCPLTQHRHDNIVQRVLSCADRLWLCFIADGVHVPFFALRNYLRTAGLDRCVVVTDATAAAGLGPGRFRLGHHEVEVGDDLAAWSADRSHLVGSAVTMRRAAANLIEHVGLTDTQVLQLTRTHPALACRLAPAA